MNQNDGKSNVGEAFRLPQAVVGIRPYVIFGTLTSTVPYKVNAVKLL